MTDLHIDKKTFDYLNYIYKNEGCCINDLFKFFNIKSIEESPISIATLLYLINAGYVCMIVPGFNYVHSSNIDQYSKSCAATQKALFTSDYQLMLSIDGKCIVEEAQRRNKYFNIPLIISIVSALISISALLYQIFDKSPILVKLLGYLPK